MFNKILQTFLQTFNAQKCTIKTRCKCYKKWIKKYHIIFFCAFEIDILTKYK